MTFAVPCGELRRVEAHGRLLHFGGYDELGSPQSSGAVDPQICGSVGTAALCCRLRLCPCSRAFNRFGALPGSASEVAEGTKGLQHLCPIKQVLERHELFLRGALVVPPEGRGLAREREELRRSHLRRHVPASICWNVTEAGSCRRLNVVITAAFCSKALLWPRRREVGDGVPAEQRRRQTVRQLNGQGLDIAAAKTPASN